MMVGDVVIPVCDAFLVKGHCRYDCAIVASVDPFVLVSVEGDTIWINNVCPRDIIPLCQAALDISERAIRRYKCHNRKEQNERPKSH